MSGRLGIIGSTSMVATQACEQFEKDFNLSIVRADLNGGIAVDIRNQKSVEQFFQEQSANFDWVILFAAYTDVNGAEQQRGDKNGPCWKINVEGTGNVVEACNKYGKKLVFISTDFIFDGTNGPYSEEDPPGPDFSKVSMYGLSKIEGEKAGPTVVIRIAYPYSGVNTGKEDLVLRDINWYRENQPYALYDDQILTPTFIPDVANAIMTIIKKG